MEFEIKEVKEWDDIVAKILPLFNKSILLLRGNLGAGKTTFTQHLAKALGSDDEVSSPTYSIVNEYNSPKGKIFHFDLYRLKNIEEAFDFGIEEYLDNAYFCIIEWPEIYETELLSEEFHEMDIINDGNSRHITFN